LSAGTVSDAVGRRVRGYKRADTPAPGDRPDSATTNPLPQMGRGNPPPPGRPPDSTLDSAPSLADVRKAGLFERPPLVESAIASARRAAGHVAASRVRPAAAARGTYTDRAAPLERPPRAGVSAFFVGLASEGVPRRPRLGQNRESLQRPPPQTDTLHVPTIAP